MVNGGPADESPLTKIAGVSKQLEDLLHSELVSSEPSLAKITEITKYSEVRELRLKLVEDLLKWYQGKLQTKTLCKRYSGFIGNQTDIYVVTAVLHSQLKSESELMEREYISLRNMDKAISKLAESQNLK